MNPNQILCRVLIIEDCVEDLVLIKRSLKEDSYYLFDTKHTPHLQAAIEYLEGETFDLILLDFHLPDTQGTEGIKYLRNRYPQLPLVVLTGQGDERLGMDAVSLGASDFLSKESSSSEIRRAIHYAIQRHRSLRSEFEKETYIRFAMESLPALLFATDQYQNVQLIEGALLKGLRLDSTEILKKPLQDALPFQEWRRCMEEFATQTLKGSNTRTSFQFKDIIMDLHLAPTLEYGKVTGLVGVGIDVSDRVNALEAALSAQKEAALAAKSKSEFLATISHEIRTPLNAVLAMSQVLDERDLTDAEHEKYTSLLKNASSSILDFVNDILDLSKSESAQGRGADSIDFMLQPILERTVDLFSARCRQENIHLILDVSSDLPASLHGDLAGFRQILMNLLSNALKFTKNGTIRLTVSPHETKEDFIQCSVSDTGVGLTDEELRVIFEPYRQANTKIQSHFGGTGLGLAIVKSILDRLGGEISVKSKKDIGTTFRFSFPFQKGNVVEIESLDLSDINILVICENNAEVEQIEKILRPSEPKLLVDIHYKDAQQYLKLYDWDIVFVDIESSQSRVLDHIDLMRDQRMPQKSVIILPSNYQAADLTRLRDMGVGGYFVKPIKKSQVLSAVRQIRGTEKLENQISEDQKVYRNKKILVIDDSPDNHFAIHALLRKYPIEIHSANDGQEGIEKAMSDTYDLVLLDMNMPEKDGFQTVREIREYEKKEGIQPLRVVAVTAYAFAEDKLKTLEAGCDDYLSKPIRKEDLVSVIDLEEVNQEGQEKWVEGDSPIASVPKELMDLIPVYLEKRKEDVELLEELVTQKNTEEIHRIAHQLKGNSGTYGFWGLTEIAKSMEAHVAEERWSELSKEISKMRTYLSAVVVLELKEKDDEKGEAA